MNNSKKMEIGQILKPQGIKGEMKILPLTSDNDRFKDLKEVCVQGEPMNRKVLSVRVSGKDVYLCLSGVADRTTAELFRGKFLVIDREQAIKLDENTFFISDMIGTKVVFEDGENVGIVKNIFQNGSADVYELDNKIMFPFLNKVVEKVDIENKQMVVRRKEFNEVAVYED